jgi:DnaJ like chaperone protein
MAGWTKWLWGGMGWAMFGPIGGIMGYALGSMSENTRGFHSNYQGFSGNTPTQGGDFGSALLILFATVMKADGELKKSELEFVKQFFIQQFGKNYAQDRIRLFKEILKQDFPLKDVCHQIKANMDHPARLQMVHVLFGLSQADGYVHPLEVKTIHTISNYMGISASDFGSIQAMFYKDTVAAYNILEITPDAAEVEVKKAYRKMAAKFHPDKVHHLGEEFQKMAEEKFKSVNEAYQQIKKERGMK